MRTPWLRWVLCLAAIASFSACDLEPQRTEPATPTASSPLRDFQNGRWLRQTDPQLASSIEELGWVRDGLDDAELEAIQDLLYIAVESRSIASSIVSLDWMQDDMDDVEASAVAWINNIGSAEVASSVVSLGWMQDGVDALEVKTIEELSYLANRYPKVALALVPVGWVQDGIGDLEVNAIDWVGNIGNAEVAWSVVSLGWMQDGVDAVEVKAVEELSYITNRNPGVASLVLALGWVLDGVGRAETDLLEDFASIARNNSEAALRIASMPFIEAIESPDIPAMTSLRQLAAFQPDSFATVMSHPVLRAGISNDLALVIATLNGVAKTNPGLIGVLLDPDKVLVERRAITLPLSGDIVLAIIRTNQGAARSMDLLEHSVRSAEDYMNAPLPVNYIGLLYGNAVIGSSAGTNFGTHIAILPKYDADDSSHEASSAGHVIAHEVAHYHWSGNEDWIDEGAADFVASVSENDRIGRPISVTNDPCAYTRSIAELESLSVSKGDVEFGCNYSLGERLFVDLHRRLGDEEFRQGFHSLYLASQVEDDTDDQQGTPVGIDYVREAFPSDDGAASPAIARWYDGMGPYDLSNLDPTPVDSSLPSINGRINEAYVAMGQRGPAMSAFSSQNITDRLYITLKYSYDVQNGPHKLQFDIVEYYEDGFDFSRRSVAMTAEAQYIGGTQWASLGASPSQKWATGRYVVHVYEGERKVAQVEYEITP